MTVAEAVKHDSVAEQQNTVNGRDRWRQCAGVPATGKPRRSPWPRSALIVAALLFPVSLQARPMDVPSSGDDPRGASRLQALLDRLVTEEPAVRGGILLVESPTFRWKGASGAAFADGGIPTLPDDQFTTDSIAKMMTATIVMLLVERGQLSLEDPIRRYLPDSLMRDLHTIQGRSYADSITVRHLLSHTSGIRDDWSCEGFLDLIVGDPQRRWRPEETVAFVREHCRPEFPPGAGFCYTDVGYNLLGLIIERATGEPLHQVYRKLLLDPLRMMHTYRPSHEDARPVIPGRGPSERYLEDVECTAWPAVMTADWAGGGLISTTEDLDRFLRAFVRNEIFQSPETRNVMFSWVDSGPFHNYGYGISRVLYDHSNHPDHAELGEIWGHAGSSHCFMFYWPREDVILVGTLNQLACKQSLYDTIASIMREVRDAVAQPDDRGPQSP